MGTMVTIDVRGAACDDAIDRAFTWFREVEETCTRFDPRSELCQLTQRPGVAVPVSRVLFEAVRFAIGVADASDGAFDPTVGALLHQRGFDREHRTGTVVGRMVDAAADSSYRDVVLDEAGQTITLQRPLLLDLGAVAKGLAVDLAARELAARRDFAIDAGGDLYLGGVNHAARPWTIGIRHPQHAGECIAAVRVSDQAVCTSGKYERGPHIVDPRSQAPAGGLLSVTVVGPSAMLADALATAAFVLGEEAALPWLERMGVEGLIVTDALETRFTPGWPHA